MNRIRFTPQADRDFIEIYQYIGSDNIAAADRHHELLRSRCLDLVDQPRIGTKRDEIKPGLRSVAEGDYVIFYRIEDQDRVAILRLLHAKRDITKLTFSES